MMPVMVTYFLLFERPILGKREELSPLFPFILGPDRHHSLLSEKERISPTSLTQGTFFTATEGYLICSYMKLLGRKVGRGERLKKAFLPCTQQLPGTFPAGAAPAPTCTAFFCLPARHFPAGLPALLFFCLPATCWGTGFACLQLPRRNCCHRTCLHAQGEPACLPPQTCMEELGAGREGCTACWRGGQEHLPGLPPATCCLPAPHPIPETLDWMEFLEEDGGTWFVLEGKRNFWSSMPPYALGLCLLPACLPAFPSLSFLLTRHFGIFLLTAWYNSVLHLFYHSPSGGH